MKPTTTRTVWRDCRFCGKEFPARSPNATHCSKTCAQKSWRACAMLAGTHGWVGKRSRQFKRLPVADVVGA